MIIAPVTRLSLLLSLTYLSLMSFYFLLVTFISLLAFLLNLLCFYSSGVSGSQIQFLEQEYVACHKNNPSLDGISSGSYLFFFFTFKIFNSDI